VPVSVACCMDTAVWMGAWCCLPRSDPGKHAQPSSALVVLWAAAIGLAGRIFVQAGHSWLLSLSGFCLDSSLQVSTSSHVAAWQGLGRPPAHTHLDINHPLPSWAFQAPPHYVVGAMHAYLHSATLQCVCWAAWRGGARGVWDCLKSLCVLLCWVCVRSVLLALDASDARAVCNRLQSLSLTHIGPC
jgi:hypothetical protein